MRAVKAVCTRVPPSFTHARTLRDQPQAMQYHDIIIDSNVTGFFLFFLPPAVFAVSLGAVSVAVAAA